MLYCSSNEMQTIQCMGLYIDNQAYKSDDGLPPTAISEKGSRCYCCHKETAASMLGFKHRSFVALPVDQNGAELLILPFIRFTLHQQLLHRS
jgi:hypothetical protein